MTAVIPAKAGIHKFGSGYAGLREHEMTSQADSIRKYLMKHHVRPFLDSNAATLSIRAGDVVRSMKLANRTPAVCSVLGGLLFQKEARLVLIERTGPPQSTTTIFRYERGGSPTVSTKASATPQTPARSSPRIAAVRRSSTPTAQDAVLPAADLCLVSCVAKKQSRPAPAKDLYASDLFEKMRAVVEAEGWPWFILSAQHGLVHPGAVIAPYEKTLNKMGVAERQAWASDVMGALEQHLADVKIVVFFAGQRYREFLAPELRERGVRVHVPMAGLPIGKQLAWLNDRIGH